MKHLEVSPSFIFCRQSSPRDLIGPSGRNLIGRFPKAREPKRSNTVNQATTDRFTRAAKFRTKLRDFPLLSCKVKVKRPVFAVCPAAMDSQAQVVVRDQEIFLFLETPSKKLLLPSSRVKADEDFAAAAHRCITEVCTLVCILSGVYSSSSSEQAR